MRNEITAKPNGKHFEIANYKYRNDGKINFLIAPIYSEKKDIGVEKQFQYIANCKHQIVC